MKMLLRSIVLCSFFAVTAAAADAPAASQLSPETAAKGLQAALGSLVKQVSGSLGAGKTAAADFSVPLPDKLAKLETILNAAGQSSLVNDFKAKLKNVALNALPQTGAALKSSTSDLKIDDPLTVLKTAPDGLTNYTKQKTRGKIVEQVLPVIAANSKSAGLAASYQAMVAKAGPMASALFGKQLPANLDQYLADQSVDYTFGLLGKAEGALRADPAIAGNSLVKQVFSAAKK